MKGVSVHLPVTWISQSWRRTLARRIHDRNRNDAMWFQCLVTTETVPACPLHGKSQLVHSAASVRNSTGEGAWGCCGCWSTRAFRTTLSTLISGMNFSEEVVCGLWKC